MRNVFKRHHDEHDDIWDLLSDLTYATHKLGNEVRELREEVNYLTHFAEEAEDLDD